jgi:hypothetical protein
MHVPMKPALLLRTLLPPLLLFWAVGLGRALRAAVVGAADEVPATEAARKSAIRGIRSKLRKLTASPYALKKKDEILKNLEALGALGGKEAGAAALAAVRLNEATVRDAAFELVEREHDKVLVKPLAALLEDKRYRRDADVRRRIAHALSVMADPSCIAPLATLIRFGEDAEVVAQAADALAGYGRAPQKLRRDAVKRLIDLYSGTWNYKESVRPADKVISKIATARYKVYGKSLRFALQALTGTQLRRPHEWRKWWNVNKKNKKWGRSG